MKIFVTGASGWIGSTTITALKAMGHDVSGLARSPHSAERVASLGATVVMGSLEEGDVLRAAAEDADAVAHFGYVHDFSRMDEAAALDRGAIAAFGEALEGTDKKLLIASGFAGLPRLANESEPFGGGHPRAENARTTLALADRGVAPIVVRFSPTVHGTGDHGFMATLVAIAREKGVSGYVGDGVNEWSAVHIADAASLCALALTAASTPSVLHAVAESVATKDIAHAIGGLLGIPVASIAPDEAATHFGWMGMFFGREATGTSHATRAALSWSPGGPTLREDLASGAYAR